MPWVSKYYVLVFSLLISCNAAESETNEEEAKSDVTLKAGVVGSWKFVEAKFGITTLLVFNPDSSLTQRIEGYEMNGNWQWISKDQIRVKYPELKKTEYWNFKFPSDSTLALNRGLANKTTGFTIYKKVKE